VFVDEKDAFQSVDGGAKMCCENLQQFVHCNAAIFELSESGKLRLS